MVVMLVVVECFVVVVMMLGPNVFTYTLTGLSQKRPRMSLLVSTRDDEILSSKASSSKPQIHPRYHRDGKAAAAAETSS